MIKINKITTKTGDKGTTLGPGMDFINKFDPNIEFLGKLDELNASLGQITISTKKHGLNRLVTQMQHQLFDIGAMFFSKNCAECDKLIEFLEQATQKFNANLKELNSFLLPQGDKLVVSIHLSRVLARSCERTFWKAFEGYKIERSNKETIEENVHDDIKFAEIGKYLNRFSDLLFAMARRYAKQDAKTWIPLRNRIGFDKA